MKIRNILITLVSAIALLISASTISFAKVVGDKIIFGYTEENLSKKIKI